MSGLRVAVLGCGPAGLMAAHAAKVAGATKVAIFSKRRKSELFGAQYLHSPISGMTDGAPVTVRYQLKGSAEDYRRKVYGESWDGTVSPEDLAEDHDAWDIRATYNNLWSEYGDFVYGTEISHGWLVNFIANEGITYDLIVSSVPKRIICDDPNNKHKFLGQDIFVSGDAPERGMFTPYRDGVPNNTVICSGEKEDDWYRISKIFGYATVEWPRTEPQIGMASATGLVRLEKPLSSDCDCWDYWPDLMHVGRFGRWEKGVLSDSAFRDVTARLT